METEETKNLTNGQTSWLFVTLCLEKGRRLHVSQSGITAAMMLPREGGDGEDG